ncbi:MAG TPA: ferrochelatase [Desulfobacterales bacterium]|nr:ferrochelatase [Desulfobacterales bacterium]
MSQDTTGVILLNLGGPERTADVRPFLYNLFADRLIIRLGPPFMQRPLAWWIARRRAPKSRVFYERIGGGSPLNRITRAQGEALAAQLAGDGSFKVGMAMRYWHPFAQEVLPDFIKAGVKRLIALTLYPHYSIATTGSSIRDLRDCLTTLPGGKEIEVTEITSWPEQEDYINCLTRLINETRQGREDSEIIYSAHSLPAKFIADGDPYLDHLRLTIAALERKTGIKGHLCFQSRSGPVEWLTPSTPDTIRRLAAQNCRGLIVVPLSFVSDHVETLYEIDIQYRQLAEDLGMKFARIPALNTEKAFISGLKKLVIKACQEPGARNQETGIRSQESGIRK